MVFLAWQIVQITQNHTNHHFDVDKNSDLKLKKVKFSLFIYYIYCSSSSLLLPFNQVLYLTNHSWFSKHLPVSCCFDFCNCALCATIWMSPTLRAFSVTIYQFVYQFVFTSWQIFADQMTFRTMTIIFENTDTLLKLSYRPFNVVFCHYFFLHCDRGFFDDRGCFDDKRAVVVLQLHSPTHAYLNSNKTSIVPQTTKHCCNELFFWTDEFTALGILPVVRIVNELWTYFDWCRSGGRGPFASIPKISHIILVYVSFLDILDHKKFTTCWYTCHLRSPTFMVLNEHLSVLISSTSTIFQKVVLVVSVVLLSTWLCAKFSHL